jgi:C-terminal processing protease CtpA/Prc
MKKLMLICLLAASAVAVAQTRPPEANELERGAAQAKMEADAAKLDAEEAKTRAELDKARADLDKAAQKVAELSTQLAHNEGNDFFFVDTGGPRRAMLGVQIDPASGKEGARLLSVSPGGAAADAGLVKGDVIVALDGKVIPGGAQANQAVVDHMRAVQPEQKVKVRVLREGKNRDFVVVARPMMGFSTFNMRMPAIGAVGPMGPMGPGTVFAGPEVREFRAFWPGDFGGMELASITPKLGAYFGATEGVLVVQAPQNATFKLEDGDVIVSIDGRKPDDGAHAMRILRSYKTGEKLNIAVLRQRKPLTLAIVMPERPEWDGDVMQGMPPIPPVPSVPPMPGAPASGT